jgi:Flp pilus assembly protein TadD
MQPLRLKHKRLANEHNTLGASFFSAGAFGLAIEQFRVAVTLVPHDGPYWQNLGAALLEVDSLDDAEEALLKAIELSPDNEKAHFHLGQLHRKRRRRFDSERNP